MLCVFTTWGMSSLLHGNSMIWSYDYFLLNCLDPYFHALQYLYTYDICNMYSNTVFLVCIDFYGVCYIVILTDGSFLCYSCDQFSTNKLYRDPGGREASVVMGTRFGIPNDAVRASHFARHHLYIVTSRRRSNDLFERFWTLNQVLQSRLRWHSCHRLQVPRSVDSQSLGVQNNQNNSMYVSCAVHEQHFVLYTSFSQR